MGVRKGTLTKRAAAELRLRIDSALREDRPRIGPSAVGFLISIREELTTPVVRLSKKQLDVTEEILLQASFGEPLVILKSEAIADLGKLCRHASGDSRISSYEELVIVELKYKLDEPIIAVREMLWRTVKEIKQKTRFDLPGELSPIDLDGLAENEDPDGLPPERNEAMVHHHAWQWTLLGVDANDD